MIFRRSRSDFSDSGMSSLERKTSAFSQRSLFRSSQSDMILPSEHRKSIVEGVDPHMFGAGDQLTVALLESHPEELKLATEAPFLKLAGQGKISKLQLSRWLSQDRLYAETYICFITSLIARVSLPFAFVSDKSKSLRWRIVKLLTGALENIQTEIEFFTTTAEKYGLNLEQPFHDDENQQFRPEDATQQYMDLFRSFYNDATLPLIEGMVVLWATEKCYLASWTHASSFIEDAPSTSIENDADGGALREAFIPNWTTKEFAKFVDEIAELTDLLAQREQAGKKLEVYKAVWLHVLDIEKQFWPVIEETPS